MQALRFLHIVWRYVTDGCLSQRLLGFLRHTLPAGREIIGGPAFGVVVKILFGRIMIPAAAFVVAPAD